MRSVVRLVFVSFFLVLPFLGNTQNYIGLHKDVIKKKVGSELTGFAFAKEVDNKNKSFIKFENTYEEQTLIFVLNEQGYCTSVSRMYNTWLFNRLKKELNEKFGNSRKMIWTESHDGKLYEVELKKGEWFVTVITRPKK